MIHASVELLEAMRGKMPTLSLHPFPANTFVACSGCRAEERIVWAAGLGWVEDFWGPVSCPSCLLLMREAIGPVRWDFLEEKGLAPKLEAR